MKNISCWKKKCPILSFSHQFWNAPKERTSTKFDEPACHLVRDAITLLKWLCVNQLSARNIIMNDFCIYCGSIMPMHVNKAWVVSLFYGSVSAAAALTLWETVFSCDSTEAKVWEKKTHWWSFCLFACLQTVGADRHQLFCQYTNRTARFEVLNTFSHPRCLLS